MITYFEALDEVKQIRKQVQRWREQGEQDLRSVLWRLDGLIKVMESEEYEVKDWEEDEDE